MKRSSPNLGSNTLLKHKLTYCESLFVDADSWVSLWFGLLASNKYNIVN
jgi:hypothetical protein